MKRILVVEDEPQNMTMINPVFISGIRNVPI